MSKAMQREEGSPERNEPRGEITEHHDGSKRARPGKGSTDDIRETKKAKVDETQISENDVGVGKEGSDKKSHAYNNLVEPVTEREIKAVNQAKILMDCDGNFFCLLCCAVLNKVEWLVKHVTGLEHERKLKMYTNWNKNREKFPFFCEVCTCTCTCQFMLQDHLQGKRHAKAVTQIEGLRRERYGPTPPQLLSKLMSAPPVKKVGNGMSLGLSPTMMKFFNLPGPFIGLKYAEEIGEEGDPSPRYYCYICNTHMDYNNTVLHFTSTSHRHNVLAKDYPDLLAANPRGDAKRDTERCARLASEIETREGRKIELIMRKVLKNDWKEVDVTRFLRGQGRGGRRGGGVGQGGVGGRGTEIGRGGRGTARGRVEYTPYGNAVSGRGNFGASPGRRGSLQERQRRGRGGRGYEGVVVPRNTHIRQGSFGFQNQGINGGPIKQEASEYRELFTQGHGGFRESKPHPPGFKRGRVMSSRGKARLQGNVLSLAYGGHNDLNMTVTGQNQSIPQQRGGYHNRRPGMKYSKDGGGTEWEESSDYSSDIAFQPQTNHWHMGHHGEQVPGGNIYGRMMEKFQESTYHNDDSHLKVSNPRKQESKYNIPQPVDSIPETGMLLGQNLHNRKYYDLPRGSTTLGRPHAQSVGYGAGSSQQLPTSEEWPGETPTQVTSTGPSHSQQEAVLNKADVFRNLALSTIDSEEDAEMALQLSSSLTQALLAYRIKHSTSGPLNELLSAVKGVSLPNNSP